MSGHYCARFTPTCDSKIIPHYPVVIEILYRRVALPDTLGVDYNESALNLKVIESPFRRKTSLDG